MKKQKVLFLSIFCPYKKVRKIACRISIHLSVSPLISCLDNILSMPQSMKMKLGKCGFHLTRDITLLILGVLSQSLISFGTENRAFLLRCLLVNIQDSTLVQGCPCRTLFSIDQSKVEVIGILLKNLCPMIICQYLRQIYKINRNDR